MAIKTKLYILGFLVGMSLTRFIQYVVYYVSIAQLSWITYDPESFKKVRLLELIKPIIYGQGLLTIVLP